MTDIDFMLFGMFFMIAVLFTIIDISRPNILAAVISMVSWYALGLTYVIYGPTIPELGWVFIVLGFVEMIMIFRDSFKMWYRWRYGLRPPPEEEEEEYY